MSSPVASSPLSRARRTAPETARPRIASNITGRSLGSIRSTTGRSASSGKASPSRSSCSRTLSCATSRSVFHPKRSATRLPPIRLRPVTDVRPSAPATAVSTGSVTARSTRSGGTSGYAVQTASAG